MFDMSGASTHRDLWKAYYGECDAVIYVVDCKDKLRVCVAKKELDDMLVDPALKDRRVPMLFFANKMDLAGCLTPFECCSSLGLDDIKSKPWHIWCAMQAAGLFLARFGPRYFCAAQPLLWVDRRRNRSRRVLANGKIKSGLVLDLVSTGERGTLSKFRNYAGDICESCGAWPHQVIRGAARSRG